MIQQLVYCGFCKKLGEEIQEGKVDPLDAKLILVVFRNYYLLKKGYSSLHIQLFKKQLEAEKETIKGEFFDEQLLEDDIEIQPFPHNEFPLEDELEKSDHEKKVVWIGNDRYECDDYLTELFDKDCIRHEVIKEPIECFLHSQTVHSAVATELIRLFIRRINLFEEIDLKNPHCLKDDPPKTIGLIRKELAKILRFFQIRKSLKLKKKY